MYFVFLRGGYNNFLSGWVKILAFLVVFPDKPPLGGQNCQYGKGIFFEVFNAMMKFYAEWSDNPPRDPLTAL